MPVPTFVTEESLEMRLRAAVSAAWSIFTRQVGGGLLPINKEASMQLQYAYILKQMLPLTLQHSTESADLELETGVKTTSGMSNIDILVRGRTSNSESRIAIELKCYRDRTASGGKRGAHDIFMKDVYEDLQILEEYVAREHAAYGVALIMNDLERFVAPRSRRGQCWAYDISHGHKFPGGRICVPIGGKPVSISLANSYEFHWSRFGGLWFAEIHGVPPNTVAGPHQSARANNSQERVGGE